ncbi:hypothetical protein C8J57DRAFT_1533538 [Mycena rebaudengoi]|nr:hypothetical protein C8J57DRAFT_1533538 [Mycena rebaudengoi]
MSFNADIVLGALLVGTWANSLLVSSALAIDLMSMIANYASVYLYTITHWVPSFQEIWRICKSNIGQFDPLYLFTTGVVTASAQSFLDARYWLLTRNKFITLTLFFFITVATGGAFTCGVTIAIFPEYTNRRKAIIPATTWLITEAVTDISIASSPLWEFRKAKSSFKETRSLLNRLVAQTIQTRTAGASIALAVLIAFLANHESNVPTGIAYTLGRVYCIAMVRTLIKQSLRVVMSSGGNLETRGERRSHERSEGGIRGFLVRALLRLKLTQCVPPDVHQTAVVHIDTPQEVSIGSFKTNPGQGRSDDSPAVGIEMAMDYSASYSSKKKQDPFVA